MKKNTKHTLPLKDIIGWDVKNWSEIIEVWRPLLESFPKGSKALAIGERDGGLSLWLAMSGFNVICTDITDISTEASALHNKYLLKANISYRSLDIVNDIPLEEQFDIIIAKSVLGGLKTDRSDANTRNDSARRKAVENIYTMLKPKGFFLSAENMEGSRLLQIARRATNKQKGWDYLKHKELQTLFSNFTSLQIKTFGILPTFFPWQPVNSMCYMLNKNLLNSLPANQKYIAVITAQK